MKFENKYLNDMRAVIVTEDFRRETVVMMKQAAERKEVMNMKKNSFKVLAVVTALILLFSVGAFAIGYLLSADEVADALGEKEIAEMFRDSGVEIKSVSDDEYTVTLLGLVSGEVLKDTDADVDEMRSYAVVSLEKNDGSALGIVDGMPLQMVPVADGYSPLEMWGNVMSSVSGMEKDGILYYLFDYESLEPYMDKNISIAVFEGDYPTADIFVMNENGVTEYADGYNGFKGIIHFETK